MKKQLNVVMFWFMRDWGLYGRAYEQIAAHLAARPEIGRVLVVLAPYEGGPTEYVWPLKISQASRKLWALSISTQVVPTDRAPYRLRKWVNSTLPKMAFLTLTKLLGFRRSNTLLWLYPPHNFIGQIQKLISNIGQVVQIVDNNMHQEFASDRERRSAHQQYESLVASADCVIVSSQSNYDFFSGQNNNTFLFENAMDGAFLRPASILPCKSTNTRPRLGYLGFLTERTDTDLLEKLAIQKPHYDVILAGPLRSADISKLLALSNVTWLGPVAHEDVPALISSFDICLIPHRDTPYSRSMSPLKLFQYLGSGRPIVTTRVAGTERWDEHIFIADSHEDFISKIDIALNSETIEKAEARIAAAKCESWEIRIGQILTKVLGVIEFK